MHNPFAMFNKRRGEMFIDTSRAELQIDQLPTHSSIRRLDDKASRLNGRLRLFSLVILLAFGVLFSRLAYLQGWRGAGLLAQAEGNRLREQRIIAPRGVVFDSEGKQLVENVADFEVVLIPRDLPRNTDELNQTIQTISTITKVSVDDLNKAISITPISQSSAPIIDHIDYTTAVQLIIQLQSVAGVRVETGFSRDYTDGSTWSAIIGYMGKMNSDEWTRVTANHDDYAFDAVIGKTGIEETYEDILKGKDGKRIIEVNAQGKEQAVISSVDPMAGNNLQLSIESGLQHVAQDSLDQMVTKMSSPGGAAIVMNVNTGAILALATAPTYDDQWFAKGISQEQYSELINNPNKPLLDRVISGEFPSGSVFKPVVASAGLAEHVITPHTTVNSVGGIDINGSFFPDWKIGGHGITDVRKALADSVNTFFYLLGGGDNETTTGLGVERIVEYAKKFGLSTILGIDLPNEQSGFLPSKAWKEEVKNEQWYLGDTYHLAIGQGDILVTPLQVAEYTATIANGGTLWTPHVVNTILSQDGKTKTDVIPEAIATQVVEDQYLQTVREGMRQAVTSGSARGISGLPWAMAAKTGTAEHPGSHLPCYDCHSWFTTFGPYEDPSIVVTVLVENGGEGTAAAEPVARDILNYYISKHPN